MTCTQHNFRNSTFSLHIIIWYSEKKNWSSARAKWLGCEAVVYIFGGGADDIVGGLHKSFQLIFADLNIRNTYEYLYPAVLSRYK